MKLIERDAVKCALEMLNVFGHHPHTNNWRGTINSIIFYIGATIIVPLIFVNLYVSFGDMDTAIASFDAFNSFIQMLTKMTWMLFFKKRLSGILRSMEKFWPLEVADDNETIKQEIEVIDKASWMLNTAFRNGSLSIFFLYSAKSFVSKSLPLAFWLPNNGASPLFEIACTFEIYLLFIIITFIIGFDALLCSVLFRTSMQFKLINAYVRKNVIGAKGKLKKSSDTLKESIKHFVDHHVLMLNFCKEFEEIYSIIFLIQFMISITTFCVCLYIFTETNLINLQISAAIYIFNAILELTLYCVPPTLVETEGEALADAIYSVDWEDWDPTTIEYVRIVMMQSQKPITFTACGWLPLNNMLFVSVLNSSISFYTLMKNNKKEATA